MIHHLHLKISLSEVRAIHKVTLVCKLYPIILTALTHTKGRGGLLEWESWGTFLELIQPQMETVAIIHTLPSKGITVFLSENFTVKSVLLYLLSICLLL